MIARAWHGVTHAAKSDAYLEYLNRTGIPDYRATKGNQGVLVLRKVEDQKAHFLLFSFWDTEDAIRAFAGDDLTKARYYPEDNEFLLELEPTVEHYEILVGQPQQETSASEQR
jgi:heme-degrading monooxygenase HmoA